MTATVAEVMVATLKASGVRRVYGLPGDSLNGFTDALRRDGEITWEHVRHEEAAAFAAAAEAALTGELAVCAGSCGPGNLHLINGLFDANRSRVPVLAIAAHIPREEIGDGYFQETHPDRLFVECSVYCELVSVPEQLPRVLEMAMRAALARGGVAVVVVPGEVFLADAPSTPIRSDPGHLAGRPPGRGVAGGRCAGAEQRQRGDDPGRGGLRWGARPAHRAGRGAEGAGGARVPRQGVRGVRQPVRRGDDRADRVQLRVPGHGALRRAGHARHRLPLPAVPPGRGPGGPGRRAGRADRQAGAGAGAAGRHGQGHGRRAAAAAGAQGRFGAPGPDDRALPAGPGPAGQAGPRPGQRLAAAPAVRRGHRSTGWPPRTRSSPSTSAPRASGRPVTCG